MLKWWKDPRLRWNTSDYGGVNQIILPFKDVWTPDITVFDRQVQKIVLCSTITILFVIEILIFIVDFTL